MGSFVQRGPQVCGRTGRGRPRRRPRALLLFPPIYDFALYDLFLKPYALCRLGAWLARAGYQVRLVNAMDYTDPRSAALLGSPRREDRGTGKFFRQVLPTPRAVAAIERSYARYGIVAESLEARISSEEPDKTLIEEIKTVPVASYISVVQLLPVAVRS